MFLKDQFSVPTFKIVVSQMFRATYTILNIEKQ